MRKKSKLDFLLAFIVISMLISLFMTLFEAFTARGSQKGALLFLALEIVLGTVVIVAPRLLAQKLHFYLSPVLYGLFLLFTYGAIYLGTIYHFYRIPYWDKGLHLISGALLAGFGLALYGLLVKSQSLPALFVEIYVTAFAVFCGVLWEFYEFTCDSFGMNLQRYMKAGHLLLGRAALMDTMGDLLADFIGAVIFAVILGVQLKKDAGFMEQFYFKKIK